MPRILVLDSEPARCAGTFKACIAPDLSKDILVDYVSGWKKGLKRFSKNEYDLVVIESLLNLEEFDYSRITMSGIFKGPGSSETGTVHIPGFSAEKISNILIRARDCIRRMHAINAHAKYIVCCHLRSGYSREERETLSRMNNVLGILNFLSSKKNKQKMLKLIRKYIAAEMNS